MRVQYYQHKENAMNTIQCGNRSFQLRDLTLAQWDFLKTATFTNAQRFCSTVEHWQEYCYIWRLSASRFSLEGYQSAVAYALRHGLDRDELGNYSDFK